MDASTGNVRASSQKPRHRKRQPPENSRKRLGLCKRFGVYGQLMNSNPTYADNTNNNGSTISNNVQDAISSAPPPKAPEAPPRSLPETTRCQACRCNLISGDWCKGCQPKPDLDAPGLYTVAQAAKLLKVPLSRIQELLQKGAPCLRVGRAVRVRLDDLRERIADDDSARRNFQWLMDHGPE